MKTELTISSRRYVLIMTLLFVSLLGAGRGSAQTAPTSSNPTPVTYNTLKIGTAEIFYREAGDPNKPTILLLHGFPTSSHMFRNLIPLLADKYHVVAPDYPGFGYSSAPKASEFNYTFDNLASVVEKFTVAKGLKKYSLYVQDYGAPVGYRLERVSRRLMHGDDCYTGQDASRFVGDAAGDRAARLCVCGRREHEPCGSQNGQDARRQALARVDKRSSHDALHRRNSLHE